MVSRDPLRGWSFVRLLPLARCHFEFSDSLDLPSRSVTALVLGVTGQIKA